MTTNDALGRVATLDYPRCVPSPDGEQFCADGNDFPAPAHTVSTSYRYSVPSRVDSSLGPRAAYSYHPNLQRSRTDYANSVVGEFTQGTVGMQARSASATSAAAALRPQRSAARDQLAAGDGPLRGSSGVELVSKLPTLRHRPRRVAHAVGLLAGGQEAQNLRRGEVDLGDDVGVGVGDPGPAAVGAPTAAPAILPSSRRPRR